MTLSHCWISLKKKTKYLGFEADKSTKGEQSICWMLQVHFGALPWAQVSFGTLQSIQQHSTAAPSPGAWLNSSVRRGGMRVELSQLPSFWRWQGQLVSPRSWGVRMGFFPTVFAVVLLLLTEDHPRIMHRFELSPASHCWLCCCCVLLTTLGRWVC